MKRIVAIFSLALLIGTMGVVNADAWERYPYWYHQWYHWGVIGYGRVGDRWGWIRNENLYHYNPNVEINTTTQIGWYRHCGLTNSSNPGVTQLSNVAGPDGYGRYLWQQTMVGSVPRSSTETASLSCF